MPVQTRHGAAGGRGRGSGRGRGTRRASRGVAAAIAAAGGSSGRGRGRGRGRGSGEQGTNPGNSGSSPGRADLTIFVIDLVSTAQKIGIDKNAIRAAVNSDTAEDTLVKAIIANQESKRADLKDENQFAIAALAKVAGAPDADILQAGTDIKKLQDLALVYGAIKSAQKKRDSPDSAAGSNSPDDDGHVIIDEQRSALAAKDTSELFGLAQDMADKQDALDGIMKLDKDVVRTKLIDIIVNGTSPATKRPKVESTSISKLPFNKMDELSRAVKVEKEEWIKAFDAATASERTDTMTALIVDAIDALPAGDAEAVIKTFKISTASTPASAPLPPHLLPWPLQHPPLL